jgi:hypothetical protein
MSRCCKVLVGVILAYLSYQILLSHFPSEMGAIQRQIVALGKTIQKDGSALATAIKRRIATVPEKL